ncbi:MAG: hypothetical protein CMI12_05060 [Oceanospirillum sp.]|nr:hypothetical protein [Oceanospirillum sp.]
MSKTISAHSVQDDWSRQRVLFAVRDKGISFAELARRHGYQNPRTLYNVFYAPYPKAQKIIADFLEVNPEEIWPSRYQAGFAA